MMHKLKNHRFHKQQAFIMPAILFISLALAIIGLALLTYVSVLRLSVLKNLDLRIARDAALSGFEYGRDKFETEGAAYAGTNEPTNCSNANATLAPYTVQGTNFCATFKIEILNAPSSGASKQIRSTGIVYRVQGSTVVVSARQVYVGNIGFASHTSETPIPSFSPGPFGIAASSNGYLWVSSNLGNRVAAITTAGVVSEVSIPHSPNNGPASMAVGGDGRMWMTGYSSGKIFAFTTASPGSVTVQEYSPPTANSQPIGMVKDATGNLWFGQYNANKIAKITTAGVVSEYPLLCSSAGIAELTLGSDNNIWFTERGCSKIGKVTSAGVITEYTMPLASSAPIGIVKDPVTANTYWVVATGVNLVYKAVYNTSNNTITWTPYTIPSANPDFRYSYTNIIAGPDNNLWLTEPIANKIARVNRTSGAITEFNVPTTNATPVGITVGADGNMWFVEQTGNKIGRITTSGVITEYPLNTSPRPAGIALGPDGNMWAAHEFSSEISKTTTSGVLTKYAFPLEGNVGAQDVTLGPDGNMWFTSARESIFKVSNLGASPPTFTRYTVPTTGANPTGINKASDGRVWFTELRRDKIGKVTTTGAFTEYNLPAGAGPRCIAEGSDGRMWFTEVLGNKIGRIATNGAPLNEYALPTANSQPYCLVQGPDGSMWFTEYNNNKIGKITTSGTITEYPTQGTNPVYITVGPDNALWYTLWGSNTIERMSLTGAVRSYPLPAGTKPTGIAAGPDGNMWYTGYDKGVIGRLLIHIPAVVYKEKTLLVAFRSTGEETQVL